MMRAKQRGGTAVILVTLLGLAGCGDSGGVSSGQFAGKIDDVCRALDRDLTKLDQPATVADLAGYAGDASAAYEDALTALKKLATPSDAGAVKDAKSLVANFNDQIDLLDAIARAAGGADQATVDAKTAEFNQLVGENADLADSLDAGRCALDPLAAVTPPATTVPPTTQPPVTQPPVTQPPVTQPPVTQPPVTPPPVTGGEKTIVPLVTALTPNNGYTFADADQSLASTFQMLLEVASSTAGQSGKIAAVEVFDGGQLPIARLFVFLPETALPHSAVDELAALLAGTDPLTPAEVGTLPGVSYSPAGGNFFFVGSDAADAANFLIWGVGADQDSLNKGIAAFILGLNGG